MIRPFPCHTTCNLNVESSRLKLAGGVWSAHHGPRAQPAGRGELTKHPQPVSTVVIAWHTLFEPDKSKSKPNITISESNITKFSFV